MLICVQDWYMLTLLSKALGRVQHQQVVNLLAGVCVHGTALNWFVKYMSDRCQEVKSGVFLRDEKVCIRGLVQGPLLFKLCTRNLPALIMTIQSVLFVDDIIRFFSSSNQ